MTTTISRNSRLRFSRLLDIDTYSVWDVPNFPDIPKRADDLIYTVKDNDRIDNISNTFYGTPELWWVIALANNIDLIPTGLSVGSSLVIPSPLFVKSEFMPSIQSGV